MKIVENQRSIKYVLAIIAAIIVVLSIYYSNKLVKDMAKEERRKIELWAEATRLLVTVADDADISFIMRVIEENTTIPVIVTDLQGDLSVSRNVKIPEENPEEYVRKKIHEWKGINEPMEITWMKIPHITCITTIRHC